ncbi:MAG: hypothetical protein R2749_10180 [Acidimicrobiales bacterium]
MSADPWIDIPGEVLDIPPAVAAHPAGAGGALEARRHAGASASRTSRTSPAGSHKPNTAVPQAYYNKVEGITRLTTETGAGQRGTALSFACAQFDMEWSVYMVRTS